MQNTMTPGDTIETSTWRVMLGALSVRITHITNAGKRGKKCAEFVLYHPETRGGADLMPALEVVLQKASREVEPCVMLATVRACVAPGVELDVSELRGFDVTKPGEKIEIIGRAIKVRASSQGFTIANRLDFMNEETLIQVDRSGPAKVLAWVKANVKALDSMTFGEVTEALRSMDVRSHYYCAIN